MTISKISTIVSPFKSDRNAARKLVAKGDFIEIFCSADLKTCEEIF